MKKLIWIFTICTTTFFACQQDAPVNPDLGTDPTNQTPSVQSAQNALRIMSSIQELDRLGFGTPSLFNSGVGFEFSNGTAGGRTLSSARVAADSVATGEEWDDHECGWTTCANEEFIENTDGSFTWILDYGVDGCEDNGYFMKGKIVETYTEDGNSFTSTTEYIEFGDEEYTMNGTSSYSGTYTEPEEGTDSLMWDYSGSYSFSENLTIAYEDETYTVESEGSETFDQNGFTSNEGFTKCTSSTGDFFHTVITTPLHFSYDCETNNDMDYVFVYVSGEETTSYQESSTDGTVNSGEFTMNYGDGTCDNLVTITENGESTVVDLGEEWEDDWEDEMDATGEGNTAG